MTVDEIYQTIATNIDNSIKSDGWEIAVLNIHGSDTAMGIDGYYLQNGDKIPINVHNFDVEVEFALMELHEKTTENGGNQWNIAKFTLFPDGNFNFDFDYDPSLDDDEGDKINSKEVE